VSVDHWQILYRGPLASCNYSCRYCPFAKRKDDRETLERDAASLARFSGWIERQDARAFSILFTPWGESLIRAHYREAIVRLSRIPQVREVAIQTNLSCSVNWMADCNRESLAIWCTFHPSQTPLAAFLEKCKTMDRIGVRYSVGLVGARENFPLIAKLREALPAAAYLWVNALARRSDGYYTPQDIEFLTAVDPLFELNLTGVHSYGRACLAGSHAFAVDGDGEVRRCHFVPQPLGNLYAPGFETTPTSAPCPNATCVCHIGYAFMPKLDFESLFGQSMAHRIPFRSLSREDARLRLARIDPAHSTSSPISRSFKSTACAQSCGVTPSVSSRNSGASGIS
jgi:hypothetical protein